MFILSFDLFQDEIEESTEKNDCICIAHISSQLALLTDKGVFEEKDQQRLRHD